MKPKLFIVTGNALKFRELSSRLSEFFDCEQKLWEEPEIQGSPEEIIKYKLLRAYNAFKHPVLVDDTTLNLEALNGFPGPYVKDFLNCFEPYDLGVKFNGSRLSSSCFLGLCLSEDKIIITEGKLEGVVIHPKSKDNEGRAFDLCVQADGTDKPMIEFTPEEKNKFSHRGRAMDKLMEILNEE